MLIKKLKCIFVSCFSVLTVSSVNSVSSSLLSESARLIQDQISCTPSSVTILASILNSEDKVDKLRNISKHLISSDHVYTTQSLRKLLQKNPFAKLMPSIIFGISSESEEDPSVEDFVTDLKRFYDFKTLIKKLQGTIDAYGFFEKIGSKVSNFITKVRNRGVPITSDFEGSVGMLSWQDWWKKALDWREEFLRSAPESGVDLGEFEEDYAFFQSCLFHSQKLIPKTINSLSTEITKMSDTFSAIKDRKFLRGIETSEFRKSLGNFSTSDANKIKDLLIGIVSQQGLLFQRIIASDHINNFIDRYLSPCVESIIQAFVADASGTTTLETFQIDSSEGYGTFVIKRVYSGEEFKKLLKTAMSLIGEKAIEVLGLITKMGEPERCFSVIVPIKISLKSESGSFLGRGAAIRIGEKNYLLTDVYIASFYVK